MLYILFKIKSAEISMRPKNHKGTHRNFAAYFFSVLLYSSLHPHPQLSMGKGGYNIFCSDISYFEWKISVNTLHTSLQLYSGPQILGLV